MRPNTLPRHLRTSSLGTLMVNKHEKLTKKFAELLEEVPTGVYRNIVKREIIPLLDVAPRKQVLKRLKRSKKVLEGALSLPEIDLGSKKGEVNGLLDEITHAAKAYFSKGDGMIEELSREVIESVSNWLNNVWSVAVENGLDFTKMHSCLLFSMGVLDHLRSLGGGCPCPLAHVYVSVVFKNRKGHIVKSFEEPGMRNVESAILWVWRDVLLATLASRNTSIIKLVPELLSDVDDIMGWQGLEQLLLGGLSHEECTRYRKKPVYQYSDDEDGSEFSFRCQDYEYEESSEEEDIESDHLPQRLVAQMPTLRKLVRERMISIFKAVPNATLYAAIVSLSEDEESFVEANTLISDVAYVSGNALAVVLEIYSNEEKADEIFDLLERYSYLLRPQDSRQLQRAARVLASSRKLTHRATVLVLMDKELSDTLVCLKMVLLKSFPRLHDPEVLTGINEIMNMRPGSVFRHERIERLADRARTNGAAPANPIALAAMMIGLPIPDQAGDEDDEGFEELEFMDPTDPDFTDIHDYCRPNIKDRFSDWIELADHWTQGNAVLKRMYIKILNTMPYFRLFDLIEELIGRLSNQPKKRHVCEAMRVVSAFLKSQYLLGLSGKERERRFMDPSLTLFPTIIPFNDDVD